MHSICFQTTSFVHNLNFSSTYINLTCKLFHAINAHETNLESNIQLIRQQPPQYQIANLLPEIIFSAQPKLCINIYVQGLV